MSVREYAIKYVGQQQAGPGGAVVGGGNVVLSTDQHALSGPEHTGQLPATRVSFDPADSGLGATEVKAAIDELAARDLTVQDEGSPLSGPAETLDFVGAGVSASGTGTTKTITIPGTPVGAAGGDLSGTYPNPTLAADVVRDAGRWEPIVDVLSGSPPDFLISDGDIVMGWVPGD